MASNNDIFDKIAISSVKLCKKSHFYQSNDTKFGYISLYANQIHHA